MERRARPAVGDAALASLREMIHRAVGRVSRRAQAVLWPHYLLAYFEMLDRDWERFEQAYEASADFTPEGQTLASDPLLLYFTSGTTSKPKLVLHSHQSYPVGHLSTMYWIGLKPGDIHLNISSPGWAKHAWSCFFAPWNAGACVFIYNYSRFQAPALLDVLQAKGHATIEAVRAAAAMGAGGAGALSARACLRLI